MWTEVDASWGRSPKNYTRLRVWKNRITLCLPSDDLREDAVRIFSDGNGKIGILPTSSPKSARKVTRKKYTASVHIPWNLRHLLPSAGTHRVETTREGEMIVMDTSQFAK